MFESLNNAVKKTATESPFSNELYERHIVVLEQGLFQAL